MGSENARGKGVKGNGVVQCRSTVRFIVVVITVMNPWSYITSQYAVVKSRSRCWFVRLSSASDAGLAANT